MGRTLFIRNKIVYNFVSAIKKPEENKFKKKSKSL